VSAPFVLAPGERYVGAPPLDGPFFRFASGQTDGLLALGEVRLPPLTSGPNLWLKSKLVTAAPRWVRRSPFHGCRS